MRPGLARLWPLPWPGRFDRAGWRTILVSWLLMLLLAALAVLIAILIFRNQPPQSPPPPTGSSSGPQSGSPQSGSQSGSPQSPAPSGSPSSGSPGPSGTESGGGEPTQSATGSPATSQVHARGFSVCHVDQSLGNLASPNVYAPAVQKGLWSRLASWLGVCALPVLAALYVAATTFPGGTFIPWHPIMVDLDVYRRAGSVCLPAAISELPGRFSSSTRHSQPSWRCRWRYCRQPSFRLAGPQLARWRLSRSCIASD